jgi:hypothetical protein
MQSITEQHFEYIIQMIMITGANFEKVVLDWGILEPDMVFDNITSALACAVLCGRLKWTTFNVLTRSGHFVCQMSKRKGSCMERSEAFVNPGSRMYQNKVKVFVYNK